MTQQPNTHFVAPHLPVHKRSSPNFNARAVPLTMLVLHYTGMQTAQAAIDRLCDPEAQVSSHYVVEEDGKLWQLVEEDQRAWHAGVSTWRGLDDINGRSIGIEIVNPGHEFGYRDFPEAQMQTVLTLCQSILSRHNIPPQNIVAHADIAPTRKEDPGEKFDWPRLAAAGIGLWPEGDTEPTETMSHDIKQAQQNLQKIGYGLEIAGQHDSLTQATLTAFQRRFRPARVDGQLDEGTLRRIARVVEAYTH